MKISISNLTEGVHAFHFSTKPSELGLGESFTEDVTVDVTVDKTSRELMLKVEMSTMGTFVCDRCIDEFDRRVQARYQIVYLYAQSEMYRYPGEEVQILSAGTPFIDITEDVRQYMLLAVPLKLLCRENCSGLCPRCGVNRNDQTCTCDAEEMDPRWQVLKKHYPN